MGTFSAKGCCEQLLLYLPGAPAQTLTEGEDRLGWGCEVQGWDGPATACTQPTLLDNPTGLFSLRSSPSSSSTCSLLHSPPYPKSPCSCLSLLTSDKAQAVPLQSCARSFSMAHRSVTGDFSPLALSLLSLVYHRLHVCVSSRLSVLPLLIIPFALMRSLMGSPP